jgi:hypothetical protein
LSGEVAFTNSRGEFFVRVRRPQRYALTIPLDDFLLPGRWEIVTAPSDAIAESEDRAQAVEIILRRVRPAAPTAPAAAPTAPPAAPVSPAVPADTSVWHTVDTLHRVSAAAAPAELPRLVVRFQAVRAELGCGARGWSMRAPVDSRAGGRGGDSHHGWHARPDRPVTLNEVKGAMSGYAPLRCARGDSGRD